MAYVGGDNSMKRTDITTQSITIIIAVLPTTR